MLQQFIVSSLILGTVVLFVVPILSGVFRSVLPENIGQFLPSSSIPSLNATTFFQLFAFGAVLSVSLLLFRRVFSR